MSHRVAGRRSSNFIGMQAKATAETAVVLVAVEVMEVKELVVAEEAEEDAVVVEEEQAEKLMRKMVVRLVERD